MKSLTPGKSISKYCLECCLGSKKEVRLCSFNGIKDKFCPLYTYRLGKNPKLRGIVRGASKQKSKSRQLGGNISPQNQL